jgi:hypothetical protein
LASAHSANYRVSRAKRVFRNFLERSANSFLMDCFRRLSLKERAPQHDCGAKLWNEAKAKPQLVSLLLATLRQ